MSQGESEGFRGLVDLALRQLGGSVVFANDEFFAEKENLIKAGPPGFAAGQFGHKGKVYDGWETRRRRDAGHDFAIVRLGCPGVIHGVVVDTAFFRGNYPPEISVEGACADGYPPPAELAELAWHPLVGKTAASGDAVNSYPVADQRRWTHVRLSVYPDGGVARLRVHGEVVPDPAFLTGTIDLAALENGGRVTGCSDSFYSSPVNLIMPGLARVMSDGWENARRRGPGNDYVIVQLAAAGRLRHVEIDTSYFVGNAPGWIELSAAREGGGPRGTAGVGSAGGVGSAAGVESAVAAGSAAAAGSAGSAAGVGSAGGRDGGSELEWREILARTRVQPDNRHRFVLDNAPEATHVRLDVFPDGGLARLRVLGEFTEDARAALAQRWRDTTP